MHPTVNCIHHCIPTRCRYCGSLLPAEELRYTEKLKQPRADLADLIGEDWRYRTYFLVLCQEDNGAELQKHAWRFRSGLWERGLVYSVPDVVDALLELADECIGSPGGV
jgi:hypothetical protein